MCFIAFHLLGQSEKWDVEADRHHAVEVVAEVEAEVPGQMSKEHVFMLVICR